MNIFRKPRVISNNDKDKYYRFVGGEVTGDFVELNLPDLSGSATILTDETLDLSSLENDISQLQTTTQTSSANLESITVIFNGLQTDVASISASLFG